MTVLRILFVLLGLGLLLWVFSHADLDAVLKTVVGVGWGILALVLLHFISFVLDSLSWQLTLPSFPLDAKHLYRAWKVRMVGEFVNVVTPFGGMGGEPLKVVFLKRYYGISGREGTASVILAKTINTVALVIFLIAGFALMLATPNLSAAFKTTAGVGLAALSLGVLLFFLVQRYKVTSVAGSWLSNKKIGKALNNVLHLITDVDDRLVTFYTRHPKRFAFAMVLAVLNWLMGIIEVYLALWLLGHSITLWDAWVIEAAAQLVRAGAFLIPAALGAQEGAFMVATTAITGVANLGLAVALLRRCRELIWLVWGAAIGGLFILQDKRQQALQKPDDKP